MNLLNQTPINTQPNYILNSYPNLYQPTPGLLNPGSPQVDAPVVLDPWGDNPTANGPADASMAPAPGQQAPTLSDVAMGLNAVGLAGTLAGIPALSLVGLLGKAATAFSGDPNAPGAPGGTNPGPGTGGPSAASPAGGAQAAGGHAPGTGVPGSPGQGGAAATQSANDPQPAPTGIAADGQGGPGGDTGTKVICTELHRQGLMPEHIWRADEEFALTVDPVVRAGYLRWGVPVVRLMRRSRLVTHFVRLFAKPWSEHMAYQMGAVEKDNVCGRILMKAGVPVCRALGHRPSFRQSAGVNPPPYAKAPPRC